MSFQNPRGGRRYSHEGTGKYCSGGSGSGSDSGSGSGRPGQGQAGRAVKDEGGKCATYNVDIRKQTQSNKAASKHVFSLRHRSRSASLPSLSPLVYSLALLLACSCPAFVLNLPLGLHDGASSGQELQTWQRAEASPARRIDNNLQVLRASRPSSPS